MKVVCLISIRLFNKGDGAAKVGGVAVHEPFVLLALGFAPGFVLEMLGEDALAFLGLIRAVDMLGDVGVERLGIGVAQRENPDVDIGGDDVMRYIFPHAQYIFSYGNVLVSGKANMVEGNSL